MEIGIWGDSIVYGSCDSEGLGWVGRLRKSFPIGDYTSIYNRGVCGDTTVELSKRFPTEADSIKPNKIVLAIGINDSRYEAGATSNRVVLEEFKKNLLTIFEQTKQHTEDMYIVSATKVDESVDSYDGIRFINEDIKRYNEVLTQISQEKGVVFIDVFETLDPTTDLFDGVHPNANGYEKLFATIAPKLK